MNVHPRHHRLPTPAEDAGVAAVLLLFGGWMLSEVAIWIHAARDTYIGVLDGKDNRRRARRAARLWVAGVFIFLMLLTGIYWVAFA